MAVTLSKGQKVDLTKTNPGLTHIVVGLGWDANFGGQEFDLDASAFVLGANGKVTGDQDFVFYNNPQGANGAVIYTGDNKTGIGQNDDEQLIVDLLRVPPHLQRVAFTITIHDGELRGQTFGQVRNAYVRVYNQQTGQELVRYDLGTNFQVETAIVAAEIYRHNGEWKFSATGSGFRGGLAALCNNFGIQVDQPAPVPVQPTPPIQPNPYQQQPNYNQNQYQQPNNYQQQANQYQQPNYQQPPVQQANPYQGNMNHQAPYGQQGFNNQGYNPHGGSHMNSHGFSCTKCGSTNVSVGKKGFGIGKAAIGGLLLGPVGLLGGFVGGNKIKISCNDCRYSYEPHASELSRMTSELKHQAMKLLQQNKSPEVLDAIVGALALVATADGYISPAEKNKVYQFINQNEELRVFGTSQVISRFDHFVFTLTSGSYTARPMVLQTVGRVRHKGELCRLIVRYSIALGYADGNFAPQEQQVVSEICRELGLNPVEFLY